MAWLRGLHVLGDVVVCYYVLPMTRSSPLYIADQFSYKGDPLEITRQGFKRGQIGQREQYGCQVTLTLESCILVSQLL